MMTLSGERQLWLLSALILAGALLVSPGFFSIDEAIFLAEQLRRRVTVDPKQTALAPKNDVDADLARLDDIRRRLETRIAEAREEALVTAPIAP